MGVRTAWIRVALLACVLSTGCDDNPDTADSETASAEAEAKKKGNKNLGATGITTFKSRSFADWQKSGGKNLFPVDPNSVKSAKELPYM